MLRSRTANARNGVIAIADRQQGTDAPATMDRGGIGEGRWLWLMYPRILQRMKDRQADAGSSPRGTRNLHSHPDWGWLSCLRKTSTRMHGFPVMSRICGY